MSSKSKTLNQPQEELLKNPNLLRTFLNLLDGEISLKEISRKTGFRPIEISFYLGQLEKVNLIKKISQVVIGSKSIEFVYEVVDRNLDLSSVVPALSTVAALDLIYGKVKYEIGEIDSRKKTDINVTIKYAQVKVKPRAFKELREKMEEIENFIREQELDDNMEGIYVNSLFIGYQLDKEDGKIALDGGKVC
jgi:Fic family protein